FDRVGAVVMCSATMCTGRGTPPRITGVPPVQTASEEQLIKKQGARLPHWTKSSSVYAVTFRLADSMPKKVLQSWREERDAITAVAKSQDRPLTSAEDQRLHELFSERVEKFLDAGRGECWLRRPEIAAVVAGALKHFDAERYRLLAWCIMPNHVHVVVQPFPSH